MNRKLIHQWRDWVLESVGDNNYELIKRDTMAALPIVAKDAMDAENKSNVFIKKSKEEPV